MNGLRTSVKDFLNEFSENHKSSFHISIGKKKYFVVSKLLPSGETVFSIDLSNWHKDIFELKKSVK